MKFDLKNIGPIKEASIKVDGLTVIAGENSIGKSAIGKAIFCLLKSSTNNIKIAKDNFNYLIKSVFRNGINNEFNDDIAIIKFELDFIHEMSIKIKNNSTIDIKNNLPIQLDSTIVETPLILSLFRFIRDSLAFNRNPLHLEETVKIDDGLPFYTYDLIKKIAKKSYSRKNKIHKKISQIILGDITFNIQNDDFVYTDKNNKKYDIINVASGIKSFGLLQLLEKSGHLNGGSFLIIDEPEVHLHPFWQIEYAKILVKLAENDIPVIVASHSPYFIEALKTYSDKTIKDKTNFYLGEMQEGGSVFKDVTDDLEPIFELLAIPMQQLMLDNN